MAGLAARITRAPKRRTAAASIASSWATISSIGQHAAIGEHLAGDLFGAVAGPFQAHQQADFDLRLGARDFGFGRDRRRIASISPAITAEISPASVSPVPA